MKKFILIILLLFTLVGCGKKTPVVSRDESILPAPSVHQSIAGTHSLGVNSAYGIVIFPHQRLAFWNDINYPLDWNVIVQMPSTFYVAGEFINGDFTKMYTIMYSYEELHTVDMITGSKTTIGKMQLFDGGGWTGLAASENGVMYASSVSAQGTSVIYTVNLSTGKTTVIGIFPEAPVIIDIAVHDNILYGVDLHWDSLVRIDLKTKKCTIVGPIGFNANYSQDMDFNEATGVLYYASFNKDTSMGELRTINTKTGMTTLIGAFPEGVEVDAFAFATLQAPTTPTFLPIVMRGK